MTDDSSSESRRKTRPENAVQSLFHQAFSFSCCLPPAVSDGFRVYHDKQTQQPFLPDLPCLASHHHLFCLDAGCLALPRIPTRQHSCSCATPLTSLSVFSSGSSSCSAPARSGEEMTRNSCRPHSGLEKSGGNSRRTGSGRAERLLRSEERTTGQPARCAAGPVAGHPADLIWPRSPSPTCE